MQISEVEKSTYTVSVMIDRTEYTSKPEGSLVGKIKRAMKKNGVVCMTMVEVFDALTSGQSIVPARLDGGMKSENWKEQSLFMVDFDSGVSLVEARERYEDAGLPPAFAYRTFSHSDTCEKFRLAFVVDDAICNGSARDKIMAIFIALSGGADANCMDRARYFNGTNKGGEFYGDTIDVSDVLSLWDDSYAALLPSKGFRKSTRESGSKPSSRSYEVEVSGNIIPFSTWYWRINAKHNLAMLNRFFELRRWVEGNHRERFAFVYYNQAKIIYGAEEALALVEEKVGQMEEPLDRRELYWAINHTEIHEETNMPELHGDGVFLFNRETIAGEDWLDMTAEEAESCGIFRTRNKNIRANQNRNVKKERDELVVSLFKAGRKPKEIKEVLDDRDAVYLYARRWKADEKNREILLNLPGEEVDLGNLVAKVGCEVLITENSRHDNVNQYYNGQRGILEQIQKERVGVRTKDGELVWLHKKIMTDSEGRVELDSDGQPLRGYPLTLAYAVTIHKSQGMTLDKANIDPDCFADGQLYVALSRVKSIDGVHLLKSLKEQDCKVSNSALAFDDWMRAESCRAAV